MSLDIPFLDLEIGRTYRVVRAIHAFCSLSYNPLTVISADYYIIFFKELVQGVMDMAYYCVVL